MNQGSKESEFEDVLLSQPQLSEIICLIPLYFSRSCLNSVPFIGGNKRNEFSHHLLSSNKQRFTHSYTFMLPGCTYIGIRDGFIVVNSSLGVERHTIGYEVLSGCTRRKYVKTHTTDH